MVRRTDFVDYYLGLLNGDHGRPKQVATWLAHFALALALVWPLAESIRERLDPPTPPARVAPAPPSRPLSLEGRARQHTASAHPRKGNGHAPASRREKGSTRPGPSAAPAPSPAPAPAPAPSPHTNSNPRPQVQAEAHVDPPRVDAHVNTPPAKVDAQVNQGGASVGAHVQTPAAKADVEATVELPELGVLPREESDRVRSTDPVGLGVAVEAPEGPELPDHPAAPRLEARAEVGAG